MINEQRIILVAVLVDLQKTRLLPSKSRFFAFVIKVAYLRALQKEKEAND